MPVGKQVFLLVIGPITTVMHGMMPAAATVKKAAFGRSKSPADAGKKIADCGSPSPALPKGGLGRSLSALATLQELRLAVGVTHGRMMGCYFLMGIIRLGITPSAKRNTLPFRVAKRRAGDLRFSVAILLWFNTQGRGAAHLNPGLGKRNSYRVAKGAYRLLWANHSLQQGTHHPH